MVSENGEFPGWGIALIIIGSLAFAAAIAYLVKLKSSVRPNRESEVEKSLL